MAREFSPKHVRSHAAIIDNGATKPPIVTTLLESYHGQNTLGLYNIYGGHECRPSLAVADGEAAHDDTDHTYLKNINKKNKVTKQKKKYK